MLAEDIPDIDFQFSQIWLSSFVNDLEKIVGRNYKKVLCFYRGYNLKFYYGEKDSDEFAKHVLNLILKNPKFGKKINDEIRIYSKKFKSASKKIEKRFLARLSNKQLADFYNYLDKLHTTLYSWGWLPNAVDMFHGNFTNYLKSILAKKLPPDKVNPALVTLSISHEKSIVQQEHESFLRLVVLKQSGASNKQIKEATEKRLAKYFYLKYLWIGKNGIYDYNHYIKEINKTVASRENAKELLQKENRFLKQNLAERKKLITRLGLTKNQIAIFDIYAEFAVTKLFRRDVQIYWSYKMSFLFKELSKRLNIPIIQVRSLFPWEIYNSLIQNKIDTILKKELGKRIKYCAYYAEKGIDLLFLEKDANLMENEIEQESGKEINELSGQTACLGKAKGYVKVINSMPDMKKMRDGDILVSIATNPDIVPAMKKAVAIITEQGGVTSHAAIVSRELRTPCIIGTKIATKVLKDGNLVEVDADVGIVKIISKK